MRLLHTSDWHLGRTLHGVDLLDHQAAHLDHLVEVARDEQVDAVLVAGDVYDRAVPPVEAVMLLSETLARLAEHTTVILTPGNHDSAARLGFGAALMRERVRVRSRVSGLAEPVMLPDERGDVLVYALPYLDPDVVRRDLAEDGAAEPLARSHEAVMGAAMDRVRADLARRVADAARAGSPRPRAVVVAHAFVVGGLPSDSERDIRVGGVDVVPSGVFRGVDYVALGHLHGAQRVGADPGLEAAASPGPSPLLRYSGSPLAYSFSELRQVKSTVLLDVDALPDASAARLIPAPVPRRLAELTGPIDELLGAAGEAHTDDWLRVTVTDPHRPEDLYRRVKDRFPHALVIQHRPPERVGGAVRAGAVTQAHDVLEVAAEFVEHVSGQAPTVAEAAVLRQAYEQVTAAERSA
ncbi:exonuclease SbcCD subunit D [Cellulomonas cellasea]|uniref:exonuclease SbcCD subunit D n=1 Tax=Cellulomonas cellasea TaxID=43670 RepID=UPI0025A35908|nr:exonuclease SbcCD subunit D [Cellulomonas cellasea]MDM8085225.1 exonuclease SbcCD subunit D [Cellulomonas cellasea]